jgi:hypothetical protein
MTAIAGLLALAQRYFDSDLVLGQLLEQVNVAA